MLLPVSFFEEENDIMSTFKNNANNVLCPDSKAIQPTSKLSTLMNIMKSLSNTSFCAIHINIQSLSRHIDELRIDLSFNSPDVVFLSETWLNSSHSDGMLNINGYRLLRNDRPSERRGGGVAMYVKRKYKTNVIFKSVADRETEFILIELSASYSKVLLGCVYKPPNCHEIKNFFDEMSKYSGVYRHIIICGDFNINLLLTNRIVFDYRDSLLGLGLEIVNTEIPTHFQGNPSLLDHVIVSDLDNVIRYQQLSAPYYSKHDIIYITINLELQCKQTEYYNYRNFKQVDLNVLSRCISKINWSQLLTLQISEAISFFQNEIVSLFDKFVPLVTKKKADPKIPWMTSEIKVLRKQRDQEFQKYKCTADPTQKDALHSSFKILRNKVTLAVRKAKLQHFGRTFNHRTSTKKMWEILRQNGIATKSEVDCNKCPNLLAATFFPAQTNFYDLSAITERTTSTFSFKPLTTYEVIRAVSTIKSSATSYDNISLKFFKLILPAIVNVFTDFLNRCLQDSCFPQPWKMSKVIPVPKPGSNEFRPISLIPILSKIFERALCDQITEFIESKNLLSKHQSGFRKNYSCKSAVLHVSSEIGKYIDENRIVFLILIDFSKAFDTIIHEQLLLKLKVRFGFNSAAIKLISSYLSDRESIVVTNSGKSNAVGNSNGVPQGSILGPVLFTLYSEDMENVFKSVSSHFYADDTQLYISCKLPDVNETINKINHDLQNLLTWSNANGIKINSSKSKCMVISRRNVDLLTFPSILVGGEVVNFERKVNNLGVIMNSSLKWNDHIAKLSHSIHFGVRCLWNSARLFPQSTKLQLVKSLIIPQIIYADVIMGDLDSREFAMLDKAFKSIVRFVFMLRKYDHISHVYNKIVGLPLKEFLRFRRLQFLFNTVQSRTPPYLYERLTFLQSARLQRHLNIPSHNYDAITKSFFYFDAQAWNALPLDIRNSTSLLTFKKQLFHYFSLDS